MMMMMMMTDNNDHHNNHNNSVEKKKKMQMKKMQMMKMNKTSSSSRRPLRERERGQSLLYPSYSLSKDLPLFTITESLLYRDSLLTKAVDVITITAAVNNNNSKVDDEEKDEDEDVVVVTSIITPTNTTTTTPPTTIRQQDHLRLLHIVSRWDANYTSKKYLNTNDDKNDHHQYQGILFDPENHHPHHRPRCYSRNKRSTSSILDYCNHNNNTKIYVDDRPPISPVRKRRTRKQLHRIIVAPVA